MFREYDGEILKADRERKTKNKSKKDHEVVNNTNNIMEDKIDITLE